MKEYEGNFLENFSQSYHPISELLARRDEKIKISPWDKLDIDLDTPPTIRHIDARQVIDIEEIMTIYHPGIKYKNSQPQWYPIDNYKRGDLRGVDVHTGSIELNQEEDLSPVETMFFQYAHKPFEGYDPQGNFIAYNEGVANVFLQPDGRIQAMTLIPEEGSSVLFYPFVPDEIRKNELAYPSNTAEALRDMRTAYNYIDPRHLPLMSKLGAMVTAAADIWLDRDVDSGKDREPLIKIPGDLLTYSIGKDRTDSKASRYFGAPVDEHPLAGLVDKALIPEKLDIIEMEGYEQFLKSALTEGYTLPPFFRSHEMGVYFSENSPFDDGTSGSHMREILGYNGITDVSQGLIVPTDWPSNYKGDWATPLAYLKHQLVLAAYEGLPEDTRSEMIEHCNELVDRSVYLRNYTSINTEIPDLDPSSPYSFKNYSRQQQEKILGGFIAGILTMNKDIFPYWRGPQLHGEGGSKLDWIPEGISEMLEEKGFHVLQAPEPKIHPLFIRGVNRDGTQDVAIRPYANPDLKID